MAPIVAQAKVQRSSIDSKHKASQRRWHPATVRAGQFCLSLSLVTSCLIPVFSSDPETVDPVALIDAAGRPRKGTIQNSRLNFNPR
jgi:hypothetical protein